MPQERRGGQEDTTEIEAFLDAIGVKHPVRISSAEGNGHSVLATWIGEEISVKDISQKSVLETGKSGCLDIRGDSEHTTIFVRRKAMSQGATEPKTVDPRQLRMI